MKVSEDDIKLLTSEQKSEYEKCIDSLCRQCQIFVPTMDHRELAYKHALTFNKEEKQ